MSLAYDVRSHTDLNHEMLRIGWGMVAFDVACALWSFLTRRDPSSLQSLAEEGLVVEPSIIAVAPGTEAASAAAAMTLLSEKVLGDPSMTRLLVRLIRCGPRGVELLLAEEATNAPAGFHAEAGGLTWRVTTSIDDVLRRMGLDDPKFPTPVEIGNDTDGTYFAPAGSARSPLPWRVGADRVGSLGGDLCESMFKATPTAQHRDGRLEVINYEDVLVVEPFGLALVPPAPSYGESGPNWQDDLELADLVQEVAVGSSASGDLVHDVPTPQESVDSAPPRSKPLDSEPPLARPLGVEVRILREVPDIVGELVGMPSEAAVEFVAYLATHGRRVSTTRLRDALGAARGGASLSEKSIWTAAGSARRALGAELVPPSNPDHSSDSRPTRLKASSPV